MQVLFVVYLEVVRCAPKGATVKRGSELSASSGRVSETENGQEQGELRTNVSKATLFQPGLNLGGLTEGDHLAALGGSELFPFWPLTPFVSTFPVNGDSFWLAVARNPHSSTQKFIVEAASEKKVRHLACFDDSDASDDSVQGH